MTGETPEQKREEQRFEVFLKNDAIHLAVLPVHCLQDICHLDSLRNNKSQKELICFIVFNMFQSECTSPLKINKHKVWKHEVGMR